MPPESQASISSRLHVDRQRGSWRWFYAFCGVGWLLLLTTRVLAQAERELPPPLSVPAAQPLEETQSIETLPVNPALLRPESALETWWRDLIQGPLGEPRLALPMDLDPAVAQALTHSAQVRILRSAAEISVTAIAKAEANFDPVTFADTRFTGASDPVGNTLTTGGPSRFIDDTWYGSGGVRRRALSGAQLELSQRLGFQNNNSQFFLPKDQATAKLNLSVTQPLLRGAGKAYNSTVIVLAQLDANVAHDVFSRDLQTYLLDFHKAYWDIYLQRAGYVQRRRLLEEAVGVVSELTARREVDVVESQVARARAAAASREAALVRFEANLKNAVARFKALVNDPALDHPQVQELIPRDVPGGSFGEADLAAALSTALGARPEIDQSTHEIQAASQRLNLAKKDLLPMLNVVLGAYVSGLQGNSAFAEAFGNQFTVGRPTYWGGLVYELPYGNRAAQAQHQQRLLELQRASAQLEAVTANIRAEVEIAVREVSTTQREMLSTHQSMLAEQKTIDYLYQRWRLLADEQQSAGVILNDLLDAQERRGRAEFDFVSAQVAHRVAWINLKRATGVLFEAVAATGTAERLPAPPPTNPGPVDGPPGASFESGVRGPVIVPPGSIRLPAIELESPGSNEAIHSALAPVGPLGPMRR